MPKACSICTHPQRAEIDAALIGTHGYRAVAKRFGASPPAVFRHQSAHLPAHLVKAHEVTEIASASALVKELQKLTETTGVILARALRQKRTDVALKAIQRLEAQLQLKARLLGELEERGGSQTVVHVVYVDAKKPELNAGTRNSPQKIRHSNSNVLETQAVDTCEPLLAQQIQAAEAQQITFGVSAPERAGVERQA